MKASCYFSALTAVVFAASATHAAPAKNPKPRVPNQVKGQGQMAGANGQFGQIYTLDNGFNFEILGAHYTIEPFPAYENQIPGTDQKLLVLDIALKNSNAEDNFFNTSDLFTVVDSKGELYPGGQVALASDPTKGGDRTLRPGQGIGQPAMNDPLRFAVVIPAKARIVKIMLGHGRKGRDEKTVRYYIAGATAAEAGEAGDPKNIITPLPDGVRDPSDSSGATALDQGKGVMNTYLPSGAFDLRLDGFAFSTAPLLENAAPDDGKKYAVATVTAKGLLDADRSMFDVTGGDNPLYEITDTDGERYKPVGYRKAKQDEAAEHAFKKGDEYTFRVLFALPKEASAKQLVLGTGGSRTWAFDVSGVK